eukprot:COSAG06_NODE_3598_length_5137_cov_4.753871_3_plen_203_part_00
MRDAVRLERGLRFGGRLVADEDLRLGLRVAPDRIEIGVAVLRGGTSVAARWQIQPSEELARRQVVILRRSCCGCSCCGRSLSCCGLLAEAAEAAVHSHSQMGLTELLARTVCRTIAGPHQQQLAVSCAARMPRGAKLGKFGAATAGGGAAAGRPRAPPRRRDALVCCPDLFARKQVRTAEGRTKGTLGSRTEARQVAAHGPG